MKNAAVDGLLGWVQPPSSLIQHGMGAIVERARLWRSAWPKRHQLSGAALTMAHRSQHFEGFEVLLVFHLPSRRHDPAPP